jgi:hypothetical protein
MTYQRWKEISSGCCRSANNNVAERLLLQVTVRDVVDQANYSDDISSRVEMWREGAGFPYIEPIGRMPRHHNVVGMNNLAAQSASKYFFDSRHP